MTSIKTFLNNLRKYYVTIYKEKLTKRKKRMRSCHVIIQNTL